MALFRTLSQGRTHILKNGFYDETLIHSPKGEKRLSFIPNCQFLLLPMPCIWCYRRSNWKTFRIRHVMVKTHFMTVPCLSRGGKSSNLTQKLPDERRATRYRWSVSDFYPWTSSFDPWQRYHCMVCFNARLVCCIDCIKQRLIPRVGWTE